MLLEQRKLPEILRLFVVHSVRTLKRSNGEDAKTREPDDHPTGGLHEALTTALASSAPGGAETS